MIYREKLIELLDHATQTFRFDAWENTDKIADYLIANGVEIPVHCKDCKHGKLPAVLTQKYGEPGTLTCHNWHSPCNKRNVNQADFCSYGERRIDERKR